MIKKISIVGTHQSGSTRLFNLCRLIFETQHKNVYSCFNYKHDRDNEYDVIINKIHDHDINKIKKTYDKVLLPVRNLLDCAISYSSRNISGVKGVDEEIIRKHCHKNINLFLKFIPITNYVFYYEKYSIHEIRLLSQELGIQLSTSDIIDIMQKLNKMHTSKDIVEIDNSRNSLYKKTLFSQDHNTSGGMSNKFVATMSKELICNILIDDEFIKSFMEKHEYL